MWIKNLIAIFILSLSFSSFTMASAQRMQSSSTGIIDTLDIERRQLEINEKTYGLADHLQVYTLQNELSNEMILKSGQKIEFWTQEQSSELLAKVPNLPTQVIIKIHLRTKDDSPLK